MARSRAWYLTAIADIMDANSHPRFPVAVLTLHLGTAHAIEWDDLLEENPMLRVQTLDLTRDAQGRIALSSLSTGSGNAQKKFNRVLYVCDSAGREYREFDFSDAPQSASTGSASSIAGRRGWYLDGDDMQVTPPEATSISVKVNHRPTPAHDLLADTDSLDWPDEFEFVLVFATAGVALMKGGAETNASLEMKAQANVYRAKMLQRLRRRGSGPRQMKHSDDAHSWGGQ